MRFCIAMSAAFLTNLSCMFAQGLRPEEMDVQQALIKKAAKHFVEAYNNHDSKTVAALFSADAELVERDGSRFVGREEIESAFAGTFEQSPNARISLSVDSLRFVTPNVAVEEGTTTWFPDGQTATMESTYGSSG